MIGTGGIKTKLDAIKIATEIGIPCVIAQGDEPNVLQRIIDGENIGTYFVPKKVKK